MGVKCHVCIGGTGLRKDIRTLEEGAPVVVGTPGRIHDMMNRGVLQTAAIKMFVMDEADEMLSLGFKDQIYDIFQFMPNDAQVFAAWATFCVLFCFVVVDFKVVFVDRLV